jgi:hypothetical protein
MKSALHSRRDFFGNVVRAAAGTQGQYEPFKNTLDFDGNAHNPQWLG